MKVKEAQRRFGQNLQYVQGLRKYTLKQLSALSGLAEEYISELENGHKIGANIQTLVCLGEALDITPGALIDRDLRADALKLVEGYKKE